jgi:hypothetical protein
VVVVDGMHSGQALHLPVAHLHFTSHMAALLGHHDSQMASLSVATTFAASLERYAAAPPNSSTVTAKRAIARWAGTRQCGLV